MINFIDFLKRNDSFLTEMSKVGVITQQRIRMAKTTNSCINICF